MTRSRRLRVVVVAFALAAAGAHGLAALPTAATYTDSGSSSPASLRAGTVALSGGRTADWVTGTGTQGLYPGTAGALVAPLTVTNTGSLGLRYSVLSTTSENATAGQLFLDIKTGVTECTAAGFDASGTAAGATTSLGTTAGVTVLGDPTTGQQTGDRVLAAGAAETLCARVSLLPGGGRTAASLATTGTTFTIVAENV